jgi:hypothetical protein
VGAFPQVSITNPVCTAFFLIRATFHAHLIRLVFITRIIFGDEYSSSSSSLCSLLHPSVASSLLGPNILLSTLFSNILSLCSSCSVTDQLSHPYKTTGKIIVLCTLIFVFLDSNLEHKRFCTEWYQALSDFSLLLISSWMQFRFFNVA